MKYLISKEFEFSAAHQLDHLPPSHPCSRLHGHNYKVIVFLSSEGLNGNGFVLDFNDLSPLKEYLDKYFDHRNLNDIMEPAGYPSTSENLARMLFEWCSVRWPETQAVRVSETGKTFAEYSR